MFKKHEEREKEQEKHVKEHIQNQVKVSFLKVKSQIRTINEQIQNIAQKKDTLCRRMYN